MFELCTFFILLFLNFQLLLLSCSVMSYSLRPHGLQHARLSCPSLSLRVCSNSYQLSQSCHPTISSSVIPFSSCPQSFPALDSFPMCQLFASGGQSVGTLASASVLPMNIQGWFRIDWFDLFAVQGTLKSLLQPTPQFKHINSLALSLPYGAAHIHM